MAEKNKIFSAFIPFSLMSQTCVSFFFNIHIIAYFKPSDETLFSIMLRWVGGFRAPAVHTAVCNAWFVCPCCFPLFPRTFFYFSLCSVGLSSSLCSLLILPPLSFPPWASSTLPPLSSWQNGSESMGCWASLTTSLKLCDNCATKCFTTDHFPSNLALWHCTHMQRNLGEWVWIGLKWKNMHAAILGARPIVYIVCTSLYFICNRFYDNSTLNSTLSEPFSIFS